MAGKAHVSRKSGRKATKKKAKVAKKAALGGGPAGGGGGAGAAVAGLTMGGDGAPEPCRRGCMQAAVPPWQAALGSSGLAGAACMQGWVQQQRARCCSSAGADVAWP